MDRGHLGGALTLSPQHLSWLTPEDSEGRRYRTRTYPWGDWVRITQGRLRAEVKDRSEKEKGAQGSFGQGQNVRVGKVLTEGHRSTGASHPAGHRLPGGEGPGVLCV